MTTIELPDDVYAAAARAAGWEDVDVADWIRNAITARAPLGTGDDFPFDDGGFPDGRFYVPQQGTANRPAA